MLKGEAGLVSPWCFGKLRNDVPHNFVLIPQPPMAPAARWKSSLFPKILLHSWTSSPAPCSQKNLDMEVPVFLVITVVLIALAFDFTNGFHDAANAIATVVATKALTMKQALVMAAILNVLGAFFATAVAQTIEKGIIKDVGTPINAQIIVLSALPGAICWNIITWFFRHAQQLLPRHCGWVGWCGCHLWPYARYHRVNHRGEKAKSTSPHGVIWPQPGF